MERRSALAKRGPRLVHVGAVGAGALVHALYVLWEARSAPASAVPILDAAYYLDWARAIAEGRGTPAGAFYLAPLYPYLLAFWFKLAGEALQPLYALQHLAMVFTALLLGRVGWKIAGGPAAAAVAVLVLFYHPFLFFPSRLLAESLALPFAAAALAVLVGQAKPRPGRTVGAGALCGVAALARPNLVLLPVSWALGLGVQAWRARRRSAAWAALALLAGAAAALAPVALRNFLASGHFVLISSNAGLTLYHGNGPGAEGIYTPAEGFSGRVASQQEEARVLASRAVGRQLDAVEADRWFARRALEVRLSDPAGTAWLLARKLLLLLSEAELSLDYPPELDENPWRRAAPVSFAWILALAAAGVVLGGWRGTGGWPVWAAVAASAVTPLVFYVSSRYRLPLALFLCVPAGTAAGRLLQLPGRASMRWRRPVLALVVAVVFGAASWAVPVDELRRSTHAVALANRASVRKAQGDLAGAEGDLERALRLDPAATAVWFNLGVVLEARGRDRDAEQAYRRALVLDPAHAEAAGNLAGLLVRGGRAEEAVPILRRALAARPDHAVCWTNLVVALASTGDLAEARRAASEAAAAGVKLHPELLQAIGMRGAGRPDDATMRGSGGT